MQKPFQTFNFFYQDGTFLFFVELCWEGILIFVTFFPWLDGGGRCERIILFSFFFNKSLLLKVLLR